MNVYEAAITRRAIRRFQDRPVPYEALEKCVEAARLAPSGRNSQACEYLIVDSPEGLSVMFDNIGGSVKLPPEKGGPRPDQKAKAYIIVLINKALEGDESRRRITLLDLGMAAENIMLVALEQGIGACPVLMFNAANAKPAFSIPDEYDIGLVIVMGYPDESPVTEVADKSLNIYVDDKGIRHVPKRKLEDIVHRNQIGSRHIDHGHEYCYTQTEDFPGYYESIDRRADEADGCGMCPPRHARECPHGERR